MELVGADAVLVQGQAVRSFALILALAAAASGCGWKAMTLSVRNVSDTDVDIESIAAPEFAYFLPARLTLGAGRGDTNYHDALHKIPARIVVAVKGRPPETIDVTPPPRDVDGRVDFVLVYTRSHRWVTRWEVQPERSAVGAAWKVRLIPDEADPQFQLHSALLDAARVGDAAQVEELLRKRAPLRWETTADNPLVSGARAHHTHVVELLLQLAEQEFTAAEKEAAVVAAADTCGQDIGTLRLLIMRFGADLGADARAGILKKAAESHDAGGEYRAGPSEPALRFLIDEARFDVNTPLSQVGHTLLDLAEEASRSSGDRRVIEFLRARGARAGHQSNP